MRRSKTFVDYQNQLRRLAWSFHYTTGIEWEELYSEACLGYVRAIRHYDANRAAASTWLYHSVRNHLISYSQRQKPPQPTPLAKWFKLTPEDVAIFKQAILPPINSPWKGSAHAKDLHTVMEIVFKSPAEFLASNGKLEIRKRLRQLGWNQDRIKDVLRTVEEAL